MSRTNTISAEDAKKIIIDLEKIEELRDRILKKIPSEMLPKDSPLRWIKESQEGKVEINGGKFTSISSKKELKDFFKTL